VLVDLTGDPVRARRNEPTMPAVRDRVERIIDSHWRATGLPPATARREYEIAADQFGRTLERLRTLVGVDLAKIETEAELAGAPWTPGRLPAWSEH
jgi:hypothetical protein